MMMKTRIIAASLAFACSLLASSALFARAAQSNAPSSSTSTSTAHSKTATHKHKHYAKKQPPGQKAPSPDRISEIQSALAHGGYYEGDPNGKLDTNTVAALEKFQSANGLDPNGKLDAPTLQKLGLGSDVAGVGAPKPVVPSCCSAPSTAPSASTSTPSCCSNPAVSQASTTTSGPVSSSPAETNPPAKSPDR